MWNTLLVTGCILLMVAGSSLDNEQAKTGDANHKDHEHQKASAKEEKSPKQKRQADYYYPPYGLVLDPANFHPAPPHYYTTTTTAAPPTITAELVIALLNLYRDSKVKELQFLAEALFPSRSRSEPSSCQCMEEIIEMQHAVLLLLNSILQVKSYLDAQEGAILKD